MISNAWRSFPSKMCIRDRVRTAEMMDMCAIIFVRGKPVDDMVVALAKQKGISILKTGFTMFTACGMLYELSLIHI